MVNKKTTIKERIKQIAKNQNISYKKLYEVLGMSDSSFKGEHLKKPINSDAIVNLITEFPDLDCLWLLTGKESKKSELRRLRENTTSENYLKEFKNLQLEQKLETIFLEMINLKEGLVKMEISNFEKSLELQAFIEKNIETKVKEIKLKA